MTELPEGEEIVRSPWGWVGKAKGIELHWNEIKEPITFKEALRSPQWKAAMEEESRSLKTRNTWEIVEKDEDTRSVGGKWVFKVETDPTDKVLKYKARVVAQSYSQKKDIDYFESYAPAASMLIIRLFLAISVSRDWKVHHFDVKSDNEPNDDVYTKLSAGYDESDTKVAELKRPVYGL